MSRLCASVSVLCHSVTRDFCASVRGEVTFAHACVTFSKHGGVFTGARTRAPGATGPCVTIRVWHDVSRHNDVFPVYRGSCFENVTQGVQKWSSCPWDAEKSRVTEAHNTDTA